jgi:hypothetical protein
MWPIYPVADVGVLAQHLEAVQHTWGDVQVPKLFVVESERLRMTERRRVRASVDNDVVDRTAGATHHFGFTLPGPSVQPAQDSTLGSGLGVLDECMRIHAMGGRDVGVERPGEEPTIIAVRRRYEDEHAVEGCGANLHRSIVPSGRPVEA